MAQLQKPQPFNLQQTIQQAFDRHRRGQLPQADKLYSDVLAVRPDYFDALHMLGLVKLNRGELAAALRLMSSALKARPKSPEVLLNYGLVLNALQRHDDALAIFDQVLSIKKRSLEAHINRGSVLERLGRDEEALESFRRAAAIKPNSADTLYNQGSVLRKLGRNAEALKCFERALAIKPDYAKAHNNLGAALESLKRSDEALASYDRALAIDPDFVEALNNRGNALQKVARTDEALACFDRALAINPVHAEVLYNKGNALAALGRHQEALACCRAAVATNPHYANAHWNEALLKLRLGDYRGGFEKYEWRWKRGEGLKRKRDFTQPWWLGEPIAAGETILLHSEQGFGDTIQFARYAPLLAKRGAQVILEVQPPLKSLLTQLGDGVRVIGSGEAIAGFDRHCPLLSLPLAFRTELPTIPADTPYLVAPKESVERMRDCLPSRSGRRVGLVWSGSSTHADDRNRSIPLDVLAPLFDVADAQFVSLQKDLRDGDAQRLAASGVTDLSRHLGDYSDTAAAIDQLDLVITVDTSVAHLAGALGKPVWILLPFYADWRWLIDRDDSPWYPTARLFRQPSIGDWPSAIAQVVGTLRPHG
jgi:tetratricopeptide (TPR) repeat protein